jgi:TPR repeat protein
MATTTTPHTSLPEAPEQTPPRPSGRRTIVLGAAAVLAAGAATASLAVATLGTDTRNEPVGRPADEGPVENSAGRAPACEWTSEANGPVFPANDIGGPPTPVRPDLRELRRPVDGNHRVAEPRPGDTDAMINLGALLAERLDPPQHDEARAWWTRAAEAGDTGAMFNLGVLLAKQAGPTPARRGPHLVDTRRRGRPDRGHVQPRGPARPPAGATPAR